MKISLVICAKNEAKTIQSVILASKCFVDEVCVIDGHSADATVKLAKQVGAKVYVDHGYGKGDAIRLGISHARFPVIVFMDADGSHDPRDIPKLIEPIVKDKADLVIASRGKGGSDELSGSMEKSIRMIGSEIITMTVNMRFKTHLTDTQNGFRAIKKKIAESLNLTEDIFTIEQEMILKALKLKHRIFEIPSHEYTRKFGESRIQLFAMSWRYVWCFIKYIL